jgi:hypothetical protein
MSKPNSKRTQVLDDGSPMIRASTGAVRQHAAGKGRFDLIPPGPIYRLAQHYEAGVIGHGERNWERGLPLHTYVDSAERHLNAIKRGDDSEDHAAAVLWNICGYMHTLEELRSGRLPIELCDVPWTELGMHEVKK